MVFKHLKLLWLTLHNVLGMSKTNKGTSPPSWSLKLLRFFLKSNYLEEIEGDLEEIYDDNLNQYSIKKARKLYNREVIKLIRPILTKGMSSSEKLNAYDTLKHNLKVSIRILKRNWLYSAISVAGLSIAIACFIHLMTFVKNESSYDTLIPEADQIGKIGLNKHYPDYSSITKSIPHSLADALKSDIPEITETATYSGPFRGMLLSYTSDNSGSQNFHEDVIAADGNFLSFFGIKMILGSSENALKDPRSMVLTNSMAQKYFGQQNPIGKSLKMARDEFKITGVCQDLPDNSHLSFGFLMSINTIDRFNQTNYTRPDVSCYIKLQVGTSIVSLEEKINKSAKNHAAPEIEKQNGISWSEYQNAGNGFDLFLVPLTSVYLHPDNLGGMKPGGSQFSNRVMVFVACLIFLLASVNFINLSTARTNARAKEIGTKKILGSYKTQLVSQVLTETFMVVFSSVTLSLLLVYLTQHSFNNLSGKTQTFTLDLPTIIYLFSFVAAMTLITGLWPAILISRLKPLNTIKGQFSSGRKGSLLRNSLVISQFSIGIVLVLSMFVVKDQLRFMINKDLGYDKEQLLILTGDFHMDPLFVNSFIGELESMPEVNSVAGTLSMPGLGIFWEENFKRQNSNDIVNLKSMKVGDLFSEVMGLSLQEGRFFETDSWDSTSVLLNESAVKALNMDQPIGKSLVELRADGTPMTFKIIGVIKDFNYDALYNQISPLVIKSNETIFNRSSKIVARLNAGVSLSKLISKVNSKWDKMRPTDPFMFKFADEVAASYYKKEVRLLSVFKVFSILSLVLACMGLFGLSAHNASLKMKEVGIRKVIGAGFSDIIILLSKKITWMVILSFIITVPIAWTALETWWLQGFAYRISIGVRPILITLSIVLGLTWITILFHTVRTALTNPINYLRND